MREHLLLACHVVFNIVTFMLIVFYILIAAAGWYLTGVSLRYAGTHAILDQPNHRSSHSEPTPRGGGVGIAGAFLFGGMCLWVAGSVQGEWFTPLLYGSLIIALLGFIDDHRPLPAWLRLGVQVAVSGLVVWMLGGLPRVMLGTQVVLPAWAVGVVATAGLVYMTNLYNFMDGIDGIAAGEALTAAGGLALVVYRDFPEASLLAGVLALASLGFLYWNWSPAAIFMGDVGSGFLGFVFGCVLLLPEEEGRLVLLWPGLILLGVFVVDASLTLLHRMLRGERFWQPHCRHAYQHAARRWGHARVSSAVCLINLLWLLPWSVAAILYKPYAVVCLVVAYAPLIYAGVRLHAGMPEEDVG